MSSPSFDSSLSFDHLNGIQGMNPLSSNHSVTHQAQLNTFPSCDDFADRLANTYELTPEQHDEQHSLCYLGSDLPPSQLRIMLFQQASLYRFENKFIALQPQYEKFTATMQIIDDLLSKPSSGRRGYNLPSS
ncbi:hypothetical protein M422DRAFT_47935 [Sphaerobolus stellatus SS14]|uniref:Uncharacterized protein n=1 Tax=Sphaerobolus stellatus (strain SS14) TaxID=990650 RepID=A0A0C9UJQ0_SPHS4|nr:hypothetical protein M422DRAFT_47935 [Sphaerobolus stellatus SS14]